MKNKLWKKIVLLPLALTCLSHSVLASLEIGQPPKEIILDGKVGHLVKSGEAWNSSSLKGKVHVLFYVAPSEKDLNKAVSESIKEKNYPSEKFASYAVVNMAASWLPDKVISMKLEASQKEFPRTIYVEDREKILVKEWGLADKSNDVIVVDKKGLVVYRYDGKLPQEEIAKLLKTIDSNL